MYIIIAILLFGLLIAAHEWGHFIAARLCGVTVHEFAIGMGPAIWKHMGKKGTEFSIRVLPIGGYCAMEGEEEESDAPHSLNNQGGDHRLRPGVYPDRGGRPHGRRCPLQH